jgi:RHS repeat-associated protein
VISDLISRRSPSAVASATAGSCTAPTPTRLKTSQTCYHRNQQYSIVGLTNAAGTLVERYTYSAYGTLGIYAANGTVRTSSTYANRYTYTGREWDADLRLYHFRTRWYDPATGGFISRDPLGYVDGMSLYRGYFGVKGVDPSGAVHCKCTRSSGYWSERLGINYESQLTKTEIRQADASCTDLEWFRGRGSSWEKYKCEPIIRGIQEVPLVPPYYHFQYYNPHAWKEAAGPWSEWTLTVIQHDKGSVCRYQSHRTVTLTNTISYTGFGELAIDETPTEEIDPSLREIIDQLPEDKKITKIPRIDWRFERKERTVTEMVTQARFFEIPICKFEKKTCPNTLPAGFVEYLQAGFVP